MSHHHRQPLHPAQPAANQLPHSHYGALVGTIDGPLSDADDNHVYIFARIATGQYAGRYKFAFNTESTEGHAEDEYYVYDEPISMAEVPSEGFTEDASLSYVALGLHQSNFRTVQNGRLRTIVHDSAQSSDMVAAYGVTFDDGTGMHDLHYNNGEPAGGSFKNEPNQDGALVFYYLNHAGQTTRRWIFIKFQTQSLP